MNLTVSELLELLDSGEIPPAQAEEAIERAGGLAFVVLSLTLV
jgi:hypothetical protein